MSYEDFHTRYADLKQKGKLVAEEPPQIIDIPPHPIYRWAAQPEAIPKEAHDLARHVTGFTSREEEALRISEARLHRFPIQHFIPTAPGEIVAFSLDPNAQFPDLIFYEPDLEEIEMDQYGNPIVGVLSPDLQYHGFLEAATLMEPVLNDESVEQMWLLNERQQMGDYSVFPPNRSARIFGRNIESDELDPRKRARLALDKTWLHNLVADEIIFEKASHTDQRLTRNHYMKHGYVPWIDYQGVRSSIDVVGMGTGANSPRELAIHALSGNRVFMTRSLLGADPDYMFKVVDEAVRIIKNIPVQDQYKREFLIQTALKNIGISIGVGDFSQTAKLIDRISQLGVGGGVEIQTIAPDVLPIETIRNLRKTFEDDFPIKLSVATDLRAAQEAITSAHGKIDIGFGHGPGFRCKSGVVERVKQNNLELASKLLDWNGTYGEDTVTVVLHQGRNQPYHVPAYFGCKIGIVAPVTGANSEKGKLLLRHKTGKWVVHNMGDASEEMKLAVAKITGNKREFRHDGHARAAEGVGGYFEFDRGNISTAAKITEVNNMIARMMLNTMGIRGNSLSDLYAFFREHPEFDIARTESEFGRSGRQPNSGVSR